MAEHLSLASTDGAKPVAPSARAIRLIAVDLDMTLVDWAAHGPHVDPRAIEALTAADTRGVLCGIASGRWDWDMQYILDRAGVLWGEPFPRFIVAREKLISWVTCGALCPDEEWNAARTREMRQLADTCLEFGFGWLSALRESGLRDQRWNLMGDYGLEIGLPSVDDAGRACEILAEQVKDIPLATVHRNWVSANVVLSTGTKGATLRGLAQRKGLDPRQVLAIGDNLNDLDMVNGQHGLTGGAVGNAIEEVKAAVRASGGYVAQAEYGAGVAEIVTTALRLR